MNTKEQQYRLAKKYPGLHKKYYKYGTFRKDGEMDGFNQSITKREFVSGFGSKKLKSKHYGNLTNKGFGQLFLLSLSVAFAIAIGTNEYFKLPVIGHIVLIPTLWYLFNTIPTQIVLFMRLRKLDNVWEESKSDLF